MRKEVVCDSSALISLTNSCNFDVLEFFHKNFHINFVITQEVEFETVHKPLSLPTRAYNFSAIKIKDAIRKGIIISVESNPLIISKRNEILNVANSIFFAAGKQLKLIQSGEAEILALANELNINYILIDERTVRLLSEAPFKIKEHFEEEFNINVMVNKANLTRYKEIVGNLNFFRTSELLSVAYEEGFFDNFNDLKEDAFISSLFKLKYSGCSISFEEINDLIREIK